MAGLEFERKYRNLGYKYIVGLDETGRGPIAGPLVVAGVVFPIGYDSKEIYVENVYCGVAKPFPSNKI